ncbi:F0F1 ATP synthase subunit epsilon [Brachybacterium atlanticum]|uniref:F0F1 ATP synthase subunit epsilon n=1 Tax=Brachybacterium atlanticum TaxID=2911888 RepID=UPI0021E0CA60|nr:F0F1 ATP synthase subunit epsilon [Brachybacterium atlanticum]
MSALEVTFVTADRTVWTGQASQVVVPAIDGSMGILPQMQPTLTILGDGVIRIHDLDGHVDERFVSGGFVSVDSDVVTIGVDDAEAQAPHADRI